MDLWIILVLAIAGVAGTVEVHFENKDGGFFLKHSTRSQSTTSRSGPRGAGLDNEADNSILSVDRFTVFQTTEPVSVRATYGPFSTKQTVPARYIVPDPVETSPVSAGNPLNTSVSSLLRDLEAVQGARHLDVSAHVVRTEVARDSPVLRVLFHTGSDPGTAGRRQQRQQRVCLVLHASVPDKSPLSAACSPSAEDGYCVAQLTIPHSWWASLPSPEDGQLGKAPPRKAPPRTVTLSHSALEPRTPSTSAAAAVVAAGTSGASAAAASAACAAPRVQIQPVTPLGTALLVPARAAYHELRADDRVTILLPQSPLYPLSRIHVPVFLESPRDKEPRVTVLVVRARVKSGLRILGAEASSDEWNTNVEIGTKQTSATVTAMRKPMPPSGVAGTPQPDKSTGVKDSDSEDADDDIEEDVHGSSTSSWNRRSAKPGVSEVFSWLLEVSDEQFEWNEARITWTVRYVLEAPPLPPPPPTLEDAVLDGGESVAPPPPPAEQPHHQHRGTGHHDDGRWKVAGRFIIQKDDIQAVLPISKNWELLNTAALTGRQVSQAMKIFIVTQAGNVADVTLQASCHTEDDSVLKVSSSCTSVYVDGSEARGSSNASVVVKYGSYQGMARFTVWMPEFPLEVAVADTRLSQIKGWRVLDDAGVSSPLVPSQGRTKAKRSTPESSSRSSRSSRHTWDQPGMIVEDVHNGLDSDRPTMCRPRYQQSPVEVYARFGAEDHNTGKASNFVSRRSWLQVTDLVLGLLRVADPRIATLHGGILQGRSSGRTEVQVLSPITGRVIGMKEVRVGNDKVSITKMTVRVVSGLQLAITPDSSIENGYIAETSVTRKLTAQYQEGLLDIDLEFSDNMRTPLREIAVSDYYLLVDSLDPEVVAFAPMVASHHPRVIAVGQGQGDLLKVALLPAEACRSSFRRTKLKAVSSHIPLAVASAHVEVNFAASDVAQRPEFVQNDGGGNTGPNSRDRKGMIEMTSDLRDILNGKLKDENNHEPTVQARQHQSGKSIGGSGSRYHSPMHTTPLEIGMYVLLAAFCFAIVVFVVSCVVYASKFSPQTYEMQQQQPPPMNGLSNIGGVGGTTSGLHSLGAAMGRVTGAAGNVMMLKRQNQPREVTTNAHDWVWLGRATLERASAHGMPIGNTSGRSPPVNINNNNNNNQVRITTNPNYADPSDATEEAVHNLIRKEEQSPRIDSSTYCKKDRERRDKHHHHHHHRNHSNSENVWNLVPPPPPPHAPQVEQVADDEYKPPVPPHRVTSRSPQPPVETKPNGSQSPAVNHRRHHHHHHHHHNHNHNRSVMNKNVELTPLQDSSNRQDPNFLPLRHPPIKEVPPGATEDELPDPTLVEFPETTGATAADSKLTNIVGNPMFSSVDDEDDDEDDDDDDDEEEGEEEGGEPRRKDELLGLDDLNMDYDQIMEYFDNLKESNA